MFLDWGFIDLVRTGGSLSSMHADFPLVVCTLMKYFPLSRINRTTFRWWPTQITHLIYSITEMTFRWYLTYFSPRTDGIPSLICVFRYSPSVSFSIGFLVQRNKIRPPRAFGVSQKGIACRAAASANFLSCKIQLVSQVIQLLYWSSNRQGILIVAEGWFIYVCTFILCFQFSYKCKVPTISGEF